MNTKNKPCCKIHPKTNPSKPGKIKQERAPGLPVATAIKAGIDERMSRSENYYNACKR